MRRPGRPPCGRPAGAIEPSAGIEVDRLVNATGLIGLAGRQHSVGVHFAGRRLTVRLDRSLLQLHADGTLLRSLPNPLTPAEQARIRDGNVVAGQRIHAGIAHAGRTLANLRLMTIEIRLLGLSDGPCWMPR